MATTCIITHTLSLSLAVKRRVQAHDLFASSHKDLSAVLFSEVSMILFSLSRVLSFISYSRGPSNPRSHSIPCLFPFTCSAHVLKNPSAAFEPGRGNKQPRDSTSHADDERERERGEKIEAEHPHSAGSQWWDKQHESTSIIYQNREAEREWERGPLPFSCRMSLCTTGLARTAWYGWGGRQGEKRRQDERAVCVVWGKRKREGG